MIRDIVLAWEKYRPDLLAAMEHCHGTHTEDDVLVRCITGQYKFWDFGKSALVSYPVEYPQFKALNLFIAGGDLFELRAMQPTVEAYAKQCGLKRCVAGGRAGWTKIFPEYEDIGRMYIKDIV